MQITKPLYALALVSFLSSSARSQSAPTLPPLITVSGESEIKVDPDMATVRLGIQGQGKNAQEVQAQINATMQKILAGVTKTGVDKKDIQTGTLSLYPIYSDAKPGQTTTPTIIAYRAQNSITIRVMDVTKTGSVVDASIAGGANTVDGVDFGLRDDSTVRQDALKRAAKAAKAKAVAIAEALEVRLGGLYEASEGGVNVMPVAFAKFAAADTNGAQVSPGQIGVSVSVTLKYFIAQ